ncbi:MAG: hypothetical protein HYW78_00675 [Parcubacteria group bacterium]|nr:hypothetical protein [Parcubacteria group bacterium]
MSEKKFERQTIIPGYASLFDRIDSADEKSREDIKQQFADAGRVLWNSTTIADLYHAVQRVITLPSIEDEATMESNLLKCALALNEIPLTDRRIGVTLATEFIEYRVMPRLNTLMGGPQPKI